MVKETNVTPAIAKTAFFVPFFGGQSKYLMGCFGGYLGGQSKYLMGYLGEYLMGY